MRLTVIFAAIFIALLPVGRAAADAAPDPAGAQFFEEKVRPVLVGHCYKCHSAQAVAEGKLKGELLLDSKDGLLKGGKNGPAIVPGKPGESRLIEAVRYTNEDLQMPPKDRLPASVVADLEKWVAMGAPDPRASGGAVAKRTIDIDAGKKFWAFQPLHAAQPPAVNDDQHWCRTTIDRFILAQQQQKQLHPNAIAAREKLIRRAYFDLIGLPPAPADVAAFVNDDSADAYGRLLDKLLASPRYGERWARHWLDVARFGESDGFEQDSDRPAAFQYRDFVIRALNSDMPFDRFVQWQIAGDELAPDDWQAMAATGFLTAGVLSTQVTEKEFESTRYNQLDDMISTTGNAMLGLTVGCARCHDHKFDPIPTADYYRLAAAFATAIRSDIDIHLGTDEEREHAQTDWQNRIAELLKEIDKPAKSKEQKAAFEKNREELGRLEADGPGEGATKVQVTSEGLPPVKHLADARGFPHFYKTVYLLRRGDPANKVEPVTESFPHVLMRNGVDETHWQVALPENSRTSGRRSALARWLTDVDSGAGNLLARVIVNRLWQHHFGTGIVATPNDFGAQGERPTNPELLEWLANDLVSHGWNLKRLHKLMMTSTVYMQSAESSPERLAIDPHNAYLWHWQPRRLEAEPIRDEMLSVAGMLDETMFGPGTLDQNSRRRSIYFTVKRSQLISMMMVLDWPEALNSIGVRPTTTVAPQALLFMNSPQARQYADGFAKRISSESTSESIDQAYHIAFGRSPEKSESTLATTFIEHQAASYQEAHHANPRADALADFCQALMSANEFVYVD